MLCFTPTSITMDISTEQNVAATNEAKLHGEMCQKLDRLVQWLLDIFPALEAVQPQKSGMQALCGLHWALDKAKLLLQYCADSSKLYLAITGDSIVGKFEKVKGALDRTLRRLGDVVPEDLAQQIATILNELGQTTFLRSPLDKEAGDDLISLLQKEKEDQNLNAISELNIFDQVASKLGILSGKSVLIEKKALKKLLEKARSEEDRKKELIVAYLLHLLRRYSKVQKFENLEDIAGTGGAGSYPPSPSERGSETSTSGRNSTCHSAEFCLFGSNEKWTANCSKGVSNCSGHVPFLPEEFRCPISLQLMAEPVIISSGQTYERACIEKWFEEGHDTCPKTQQKLCHLSVTPNYCVKGLIASWCERCEIPLPEPPSPPSSPLTVWRWDLLSESGSMKGGGDHLKGATLMENATIPTSGNLSKELLQPPNAGKGSMLDSVSMMVHESSSSTGGDSCSSLTEREAESGGKRAESSACLEKLLADLKLPSLEAQCRAAEEICLFTKDNAEARSYVGDNEFIPALVGFLQMAIHVGDVQAQEIAAVALLNVSINNNRNKAEIVAIGAVPLLLKLFDSNVLLSTKEAAVVVLLTISYLDENKASIGSSGAISYLVDHLDSGSDQGVRDALTALLNLSIYSGNCPCMINSGIVPKLVHLLAANDTELTENCMTVLYNLASLEEGRSAIAEMETCILSLAEILDTGTLKEKEHAAATFLLLCTSSLQHSQLVLREGVIPSLVMLSVTGSPRGRDKAQKLLQHFREQRQKECMWNSTPQVPFSSDSSVHGDNIRRHDKGGSRSISRKNRSGPSFNFFRRSKSLAFYHC